MTDDELAYTRRVLDVFAKAHIHSELLWHVERHRVVFSADVSDVFAWGGADAEEITPSNLPVLEQAYADLKAVCAEEHAADLFAARVRRMRPQGAAYPTALPAQRLFDACGPQRPPGLGNPKAAPRSDEESQR